ncbi:ABC transporter permease [Abyssibius alkaniclasticus]|uniref:ABC transporter permease n=1 Tax=Abyssibius alkaniclasticus TaxID=2881234 RepID=UPI0023642068|nr:ABC transporter permease [Abyssibius alkaniclasticus]UPH72280.1 ABC transporter permease [Abyssibius alkaniclasticus]|tara:strand:+ start:318 stop:1268 length:951 start_codon:yes stop_codon:yes gene_type:complete
MLNYAIKRILLAVVILIVVMLGMFAMVFVIPGDPATVALGPRASPELKALLIARMGLDQPLGTQILSFFGSILKGDLGIDVWSQRPVLDVILEVFPQTLILGVVSLGWALVGGIALGCMAVIWRDSFIDRVLGVLSVAMISVPSFVIALYSLLIFAVLLNWLPAIGAGERGDFWSQFRALILPSFAIGITWVGYLARLVRASMLEVMGANHVRTARAFGLPETRVVLRYALRIAIVPTIAIVAIGFGSILSSAVFVETVFSRPGIGTLITGAVEKRNYPVVMGTVLFMTGFYLLVVTSADLLIAKLDPRVRDVLRG